ncbi:hypothetical protein Tco_0699562 [Tanacetum coccineum]
MDKKDYGFYEILDDLFRIGAENLKRIGQEKVENRCDDDTSMDTNHESGNLLNFPIFPATNEFSCISEHDVDNINDLEKEVAQVEDEDVEQIRQFLTPNIFDVMDNVIQPLILKTIHTTPPDNDYVAPATSLILDDLLEEFRNEILNVTMVDEGAECNPTKDIEELERLLAKDLQSYFTEIEVHLVILKTNDDFEPSIHTRPLNPLCGIFKSHKSLTKLYKVKRELTSPPWILQHGDEIRASDDYDVQETNIILYGLPPDMYALVNHQEVVKDIWDKVKLQMKGTELSYQEREFILYNLFDKFASIQDETLYEYYWRFSQPINDMNTIRMKMQQV